MVQATLVTEQANGGTKLLLKLRERGFDMAAACWAKTYDDGKPYLYIVSPSIAGKGTRAGITVIHDALFEMEDEWTHPFERINSSSVKLIDSGHLLAGWLKDLYSKFPPSKTNKKMASNFDAVFVPESVYGDWAWVYPSTLFAAPQPIA